VVAPPCPRAGMRMLGEGLGLGLRCAGRWLWGHVVLGRGCSGLLVGVIKGVCCVRVMWVLVHGGMCICGVLLVAWVACHGLLECCRGCGVGFPSRFRSPFIV